MKSAEFRQRLEQKILVCDGAMGSQLYELLGPTRCFEESNLQQPEAVLRIHLAYIQAGARLIETNTFGANRAKLAALGKSARPLLELGADVVGANCSIGPQDILAVLRAMAQANGVRLSVQPNAGFPHRMGGRV